ncbi:MAG: hypothetical protein GY720_02090 [bacterium]|nr:hypothetical protein [bacterium]
MMAFSVHLCITPFGNLLLPAAFKEALAAITGDGTSGMVDHIQLFLDVVDFVPG